MSILDDVEIPQGGPQIITICGDAGTGKSSLAATLPNPIFIRAEDGVARIPKGFRPKALPPINSADQLWDQIKALLRDDHDYKTLVVDSVSALDRIFVQSIMDTDGKAKSLNAAMGGYGAGFNALASMHQRVRKGAELLRQNRGMNVVFLAHAEVDRVSPPDGDDYSRYSLRMTHNKSLPPYVDDVDMVGFLRQAMFFKGGDGERKRVISTDDRELVCHLTANNVSKNAYGITEAIPVLLGVNPLAEYHDAFSNKATSEGESWLATSDKTKTTESEDE